MGTDEGEDSKRPTRFVIGTLQLCIHQFPSDLRSTGGQLDSTVLLLTSWLEPSTINRSLGLKGPNVRTCRKKVVVACFGALSGRILDCLDGGTFGQPVLL